MLRQVVLASICFLLISGCALTETSDVAVENKKPANPTSAPQVQPVVKQSVGAQQPKGKNVAAANADKSIRSEDVKRIQAYLSNVGFFSGPVDGVLNGDTQTAIQRFQSVCVNLKDLIRNPNRGLVHTSAGRSMAKPGAGKDKEVATNSLRLVQLRLKDAGFNPGPIDGIDGPRTQSALLALQTGCLLLDSIPIGPASRAHAPRDDSAVNTATASASVQRATNPRPDGSTGTITDNSVQGAVKALQRRLRDAGFDPGEIDGILGPRTIAAAQSYQLSLH